MKLIYCLILIFVPVLLQAQIVNIPDSNFKNALVNEPVADTDGNGTLEDADTNNDGEIQVSEALAVTILQVHAFNIDSLEGIQSFENLERLLCFNNNLTAIDLSQNTMLLELWVNGNNLITLDVTALPNLDWLSCSDNALTDLDVTQNLNLRILRTSRNQISSIDVSENSLLEHFWCSSNLVSTLDISNNALIVNFTARDNSQLASLNVQNGNNSNMVRMWAQDNPVLDCILVDDKTAIYPSCDLGGNTGWCKDSETIYSEDFASCILSSNYLEIQNIALYPNPTSTQLNIVSNQAIESVKIVSTAGNLIGNFFSKTIDLRELSEGMYFVIIELDDNRLVFKKVIKISR